jgi:ribonuclease J
VCDSTNALKSGWSRSEGELRESLTEVIGRYDGRVAVACFASNVARLSTIAKAAQAHGRDVALVGRSLHRIDAAARENGYLTDLPRFLTEDEAGYVPRDKLLLICTGSQGEPRAALARISEDQHPDVTFSKGDTVIFSSRTIPGNEKAVGRVINGLVRQSVEVVTDRTHLVHVSGHPRRAEMEELYRRVRPRIAIPVHGEALHLSEHAKLARAAGVSEVVLCGDGDLVRLAPNAGVIDEVPAARLYKDGALLISAEARTVADRRRLSFSGIAIVAMALSDKGQLVADPDVELIGIPELNADKQSMHAIAYDAVIETFESLPKARRRDPQAVEESIKRAVRAAIAGHWRKKPICLVQVLTV